MNFTHRDMSILVASFLLIIFVSITFPALGMTDGGEINDTSVSDVPSLELNENRLELMGERPERPRSPTGGELRYNTDRTAGDWQVTLYDSDNKEVFLTTFVTNDDPTQNNPEIQISELEKTEPATTVGEDNITLMESNFTDRDQLTLETDNYTVGLDLAYMENWGTDALEYHIIWELIESEQGDSSGFLASIPIVGGIASSASDLASVGVWGVSVVFWFFGWLLELAINAVIILTTAFLYLFDLGMYISNVQLEIVTAAPSSIAAIIMAAYILFLAEVAKVILILISVLPTT